MEFWIEIMCTLGDSASNRTTVFMVSQSTDHSQDKRPDSDLYQAYLTIMADSSDALRASLTAVEFSEWQQANIRPASEA